jgi:hypothetical protein
MAVETTEELKVHTGDEPDPKVMTYEDIKKVEEGQWACIHVMSEIPKTFLAVCCGHADDGYPLMCRAGREESLALYNSQDPDHQKLSDEEFYAAMGGKYEILRTLDSIPGIQSGFVYWGLPKGFAHNGVITAYFETRPLAGKTYVSFSFCSPNDRFNKQLARKIAKGRFYTQMQRLIRRGAPEGSVQPIVDDPRVVAVDSFGDVREECAQAFEQNRGKLWRYPRWADEIAVSGWARWQTDEKRRPVLSDRGSVQAFINAPVDVDLEGVALNEASRLLEDAADCCWGVSEADVDDAFSVVFFKDGERLIDCQAVKRALVLRAMKILGRWYADFDKTKFRSLQGLFNF